MAKGYHGAHPAATPLYCFCGNIPRLAHLRDCKRDASEGTVEALQKIVPAIHQRFGNQIRIIVRAAGADQALPQFFIGHGNLQLRCELLVVERRMIERAFATDLAHT
jgi:hypothetical protein